MSVSEKILKSLLQINAIQLNPQKPFTWASGMRSPIYCDNRLSLSFPETRLDIISGFKQLMSKYENPDIIIGVATAGIAHGALLAHDMGLPFAYVRSKKKAHGKENAIEGYVQKDQKCVVIEDLISTGGSSIAAAQALQSEGLEILSILSIFNYNLNKALENFKESGISFDSICDYKGLLRIAQQENLFSKKELDLLESWSESPQKWSDHYVQQEKL